MHPRKYPHKEYTNTNYSLGFYDNFGLIFKGSEDIATKGTANEPLSTRPMSIDISLHENPSEQ